MGNEELSAIDIALDTKVAAFIADSDYVAPEKKPQAVPLREIVTENGNKREDY